MKTWSTSLVAKRYHNFTDVCEMSRYICFSNINGMVSFFTLGLYIVQVFLSWFRNAFLNPSSTKSPYHLGSNYPLISVCTVLRVQIFFLEKAELWHKSFAVTTKQSRSIKLMNGNEFKKIILKPDNDYLIKMLHLSPLISWSCPRFNYFRRNQFL